jgi:hypothetical protein
MPWDWLRRQWYKEVTGQFPWFGTFCLLRRK